MKVSLGTLDVVVKVVTEGVDQVHRLISCSIVFERPREQHWREGEREREREREGGRDGERATIDKRESVCDPPNVMYPTFSPVRASVPWSSAGGSA